jgi:hypothetical protein
MDDAYPHISQGTHGHAVAFAFAPRALVVCLRPGLLEGGLPGKLIQHVAEGFDTGIAPMRFRIVATLVGHRRGTGQGLDTGRAQIPLPLVAPSCQQPGRKTLTGTWETSKDRAVRMAQKKAADLRIILLDLLHQRRQLAHQREQQARLGPGGDGVGLQLRLVQPLPQGLCRWIRRRMVVLAE